MRNILLKLDNFLSGNGWTACRHELTKRTPTRGYHSICDPKLGGCGTEFGREG